MHRTQDTSAAYDKKTHVKKMCNLLLNYVLQRQGVAWKGSFALILAVCFGAQSDS